MKDRDEHLGRRLYDRRRALGLTQKQLSKLVGISFQQVQRYECAANKMSATRLWDFAEALDVPVSYFYDGLQPDRVLSRGTPADGERPGGN